MKFELRDEAQRVREELGRWATKRRSTLGALAAFDEPGWRDLAHFGLMLGTADAMRDLDVVVGMLAAAQGGLPGPVLEAELACASGNDRARALLREGRVVTSVVRAADQPTVVGWGAAADLVVDQATGEVLAEGPLPEVHMPLRMAHGWIQPAGASSPSDPLRARRWLLASALLVGLGLGALDVACAHVRTREQFGRTLSSFQAVQFRLADTSLQLEAAQLAVIDAARRSDAGDSSASVAAALAWLNGSRAAAAAEKDVHQVLGAIGFTEELGVIRLTYQMAWLRTSVGRRSAARHVLDARAGGSDVPASTVLGGFAN